MNVRFRWVCRAACRQKAHPLLQLRIHLAKLTTKKRARVLNADLCHSSDEVLLRSKLRKDREFREVVKDHEDHEEHQLSRPPGKCSLNSWLMSRRIKPSIISSRIRPPSRSGIGNKFKMPRFRLMMAIQFSRLPSGHAHRKTCLTRNTDRPT